MNADFEEKFDSFVMGCNEIVSDYMAKNFPTLGNQRITFSEGRRYIKLIKHMSNGQRSVFCFVDMNTGDVLKAASWKSPAKGSRGNIFDENNGLKRITPYGAEYNI